MASAPHSVIAMGSSATDGSQGGAELQLRLRCPRCTANVSSLNCLKCCFELRENGGIILALPPARVEHYSSFVEDYERIRTAEGRGSNRDDFYLGLPYRDASGQNRKQWVIRARTFDYLKDRILAPNLAAGARILDLGAGNCWMSFRLAQAGYMPIAVDLLTNSYDGMGAAEHYRRHLREYFPRFQAEAARLPFQDGQLDAVVFNASFHYAEDAETVLGEALRCVKRSGLVIISDTPWYSAEKCGNEMVQERRMNFMRRYGTASASLNSVEFLTDERLQTLARQLDIHWHIHSPNYGLWWAMRPYLAKLQNRREPGRFRIYVAQRVTS